MRATVTARSGMACLLASATVLCSCSFFHDGRKAFEASQKAAMHTKQFTVELDDPAKMMHIERTQVLDCTARYFYEHEVLDRTEEGIATGGSLSQGRPSAHQERETLFVSGKTYGRNTSSWENAAQNGDAYPDWHPLSMSRDPSDECKATSLGKSLGYVNYGTILEEGRIEYLGRQKVNGHRCLEYDVKFASQVLKEAKVCLGSSDDLPYRVMRDDYTATYNYEPVPLMPVPEQTVSPSAP